MQFDERPSAKGMQPPDVAKRLAVADRMPAGKTQTSPYRPRRFQHDLLRWTSSAGARCVRLGRPQNLLTVVGHSSPGNPFFRCPLYTLCDAPVFTKVCLGFNIDTVVCPFPPYATSCYESASGEFYLNPGPGTDCTVAVETKTWSEIKDLYNN